MESYKKFKKFIFETAPAYEKLDKTKSYTNQIMNTRKKLGFTKFFYPGTHIEGEVKIFNRRFNNHAYKYFKLFGPRAEIFWIFVVFYLFRKLTQNSIRREEIDQLLVDRDAFFVVRGVDEKYLTFNKSK